jgi:hypothetical protein
VTTIVVGFMIMGVAGKIFFEGFMELSGQENWALSHL